MHDIICEEDQVLHVLVRLDSEYDSFVASISSRFEVCRMQDIVALLLAHENKLEQHNILSDTTSMTVNVATKNLNYVMNPSGGRRLHHSKKSSNKM